MFTKHLKKIIFFSIKQGRKNRILGGNFGVEKERNTKKTLTLNPSISSQPATPHSFQVFFLLAVLHLSHFTSHRRPTTTPTPFHFHKSLPSTKRSSPITLLHLTELNPSPSITVLSHRLQIPTDVVPLLSQPTHRPPSPGRHQHTTTRPSLSQICSTFFSLQIGLHRSQSSLTFLQPASSSPRTHGWTRRSRSTSNRTHRLDNHTHLLNSNGYDPPPPDLPPKEGKNSKPRRRKKTEVHRSKKGKSENRSGLKQTCLLCFSVFCRSTSARK